MPVTNNTERSIIEFEKKVIAVASRLCIHAWMNLGFDVLSEQQLLFFTTIFKSRNFQNLLIRRIYE
jgi:hypothetical protein